MRNALIGALVVAAGASVSADTHIIPTGAATAGGSGAYSTILHAQPRSYQVVIGPAHLPTLPSGSAALITGVQWRLASWQAFPAWPSTPRTFTNFDIMLSKSLNPAGSLSSVYTENIGPDAVMVRSGSITFDTGVFPGGAVSPSFNQWGPVIQFATPYLYTGGDLLITIRHTGGVGSNGNLDWIAGAGCQAIGVSSYTQANKWYAQGNGGAIAHQITYNLVEWPPLCYPNCDESTGTPLLTGNDFVCFINNYATGNPVANCDGSSGAPLLTANDFVCFVNSYAAGCP